jgi:hypothetical protein
MDPIQIKIIGIQDYLWEQVTALATPLGTRYNVLTKNIYGSAFYSFYFNPSPCPKEGGDKIVKEN